MREGSAADLVIMDYQPPTPLTGENLASHFLFAFSSRMVEAVMVDGVWRMWARRPLSVNPEELNDQARKTARSLWAKMAEV